MRSLLAAMERMKVEDARRCAQAMLGMIRVHCGWFPGQTGLITDIAADRLSGRWRGADGTAEAPELAIQDAYFVKHWWGMMAKYIFLYVVHSGWEPGSRIWHRQELGVLHMPPGYPKEMVDYLKERFEKWNKEIICAPDGALFVKCECLHWLLGRARLGKMGR